MNRIIATLFLLLTFQVYSQHLTYGTVLGLNSTDSESNYNSLIQSINAPNLDGFNLGIYLDYQIKNKIGVKSSLIYNSENETYRSKTFNQPSFNIKVNSIQLSSVLKFHLKNNYLKGFYLIAGPRVTSILNTKNKKIPELNAIHKKLNFGVILGFGFNIYKFVSSEFIFDYGLNNITNVENLEINTYNLKINLNFDLSKFI